MEIKEGQNERLKNALCYIPMVAFVLFFIEENKTKTFEKHMRYWMVFFIVYFVLTILMSWLFMGLLFLFYMGVSIVFGYKAYIWEDIKLEFLDNFFEKNLKK